MSLIRFIAVFFLTSVGLILPFHLCAKEYTVKFNCWDINGAAGCQKVFGGNHPGIDSHVFDWYDWTSLGDPQGSRIPNRSGKAICAFHIKINGTDDTFEVPNDAGGMLFQEVWQRKDAGGKVREVLFNVAAGKPGIASSAKFWSYVYPQTPGYPAPYFLGKAFESRQPDPDPKLGWERVPSSATGLTKFPMDRFPREYRDIRTYAEATNGGILMISDDDILWMNPDHTELRAVQYANTNPAGVNRITVSSNDKKKEEFIVWKNGEEILRIPATPKLWPENLLKSNDNHTILHE